MGPLEERSEIRVVERLAGGVRVDLHAHRAEIPCGAHRLGDRRVGIVQGQRRQEPGESIGMFQTISARPSLPIRASSDARSGPQKASIGGDPSEMICE